MRVGTPGGGILPGTLSLPEFPERPSRKSLGARPWPGAIGHLGGHPQPRLSRGPPGRTGTPGRRVLTDFPCSLFTAAQQEHLVKLRFRLLASSVRAQVEVVGLWVLLAPGSPG